VWRVTTTTMLTWQAPEGHGFEGVRAHFGSGAALRALGRIVYAGDADWTASYRLVVREDGSVERVSITSATAERERHLTINRTEDGFWLLDTGSGGTRTDFGGAVDIDLATSAMFNAIPIRRLGLHREAGEHALTMVFVSLPELEPSVVTQTYRTLEAGDPATIGFTWDDFSADLTVDSSGLVLDYPGIATRHATAPAQA
jgi:uncharacterized protein